MLQKTTAAAPARAASETTRPAAAAGSMGKIFLLVGVAILIFLGFSAYSVQRRSRVARSSRRSRTCTSRCCNAWMRTLCASIRWRSSIFRWWWRAIVTDHKAADLSSQGDGAFAEIEQTLSGQGSPGRALAFGPECYQTLATKTSSAFLNQTGGDMAALTGAMNKALATCGPTSRASARPVMTSSSRRWRARSTMPGYA